MGKQYGRCKQRLEDQDLHQSERFEWCSIARTLSDENY